MPSKRTPISLPLETSEFTLHIALTNLPQKNSSKFVEKVKEHLFRQYKKNSEQYLVSGKLEENLFNPLEYYVFGSYDIAFVSLVDRFKFSQKLFVPPPEDFVEGRDEQLNKGADSNYDSSAFQIISGVCPVINSGFKPQKFFQNQRKLKKGNRFVTICNLKLNNKLLIGNGTRFYDQVVITINEVIKEMFELDDTSIKEKYFIMQSFSWFEISIVLFTDKLKGLKSKGNPSIKSKGSIKTFIGKLRILTLDDLDRYTNGKVLNRYSGEQLFESSLYKTDPECNPYNAKNVFLFADSHSYIGVRKEIIEKDGKLYPERIQTQIEAQLKPGYLKEFKKTIAKINIWKNKPIHDSENDTQALITGKYDYQFQLKSKNIAGNLALIKAMTSPGEISDALSKYTRKLKTSIIFDYDPIADNDTHDQIEFRHILKKRFIKDLNINIRYIDEELKTLKVSRLIRGKVGKIFYNYINTVQDSILFVFMLDLVDFIAFLQKFISHQNDIFKRNFQNISGDVQAEFEMVDRLERKLVEIIEIIQKSYQLRLLNSYQFEDINDFDLDYNSSPQQILSAYNSLAKELQKLFFPARIKYGFPDSPVISINLRHTVATAYSINYDVYHLISPEFIFFTVLKEILNKYREIKFDDQQESYSSTGRSYSSIKKHAEDLSTWIEGHKYFSTLKESGLGIRDIDNIYLDYVRLGVMFNFDYEMFVVWSWTYNFQNAALYDSIGLMNEIHFRKELIRILFVGFLTNNEKIIENLKSPLPEVQIYWNRYFEVYKKELKKMFEKQVMESGIDFKNDKIRNFNNSIIRFFEDVFLEALPKNPKSIQGREIERDGGFFSFIKNAKQIYDDEQKELFFSIKEGKPILYNPAQCDPYIFIFQIGYTYLKYIYTENKMHVNLVRRNWENGKPLSCFIQKHPEKSNWLYNVDQMGGLFFTNNEMAKKYFKIRNSIMLSIWHLGMLLKKEHFFIK